MTETIALYIPGFRSVHQQLKFASKILQVSVRTLYRWHKEGKLTNSEMTRLIRECEDGVFTPSVAAQKLGVKRWKIYKMVEEGELSAVRLPGSIIRIKKVTALSDGTEIFRVLLSNHEG